MMSEKITFKELVELIAEQSKQSQNSTSNFISELVELIEGGLKKSGSVSISGFGKFELRWMKERAGVNPQTGESINIPGQNKIVFKPYKLLREDVNRPYAKMKAQILESTDKKTDTGTHTEDNQEPVKEQLSESVPSAEPPIDLQSESVPLTEPAAAINDEESDLIVEREIPAPKSAETEEEFQLFDEQESEPAQEKPTKPEKTREPIPILTKTDLPSDESVLAEEVQKTGNMNWSYAAAAIVVALVIVAMMFLMRNGSVELDTSDQIVQSQTEQLVAPADQTDISEEVEPEAPPPPFFTESYQIEQGDSLWSIAEENFGNPYLWPLIYYMNPGLLENPNIIDAGINLTIPIVPDPENLTDDQLEMVASGYYSIYEWALDAQPDQAKHFLWAVGVFSPDKLSRVEERTNSNDWAFAKYR